MGTEIRSFYSIKEICEILEEEIQQYQSLVDEYSQWLGSFLRDSETMQENKEQLKRMEALQKGRLKVKAKPKKKGKSKSTQASADWIQFREVMLSATDQGEAEILFEAIEEINVKLQQLERARDSIVHLEKGGLGKNIVYITYMCDGIPEKIVLRHREGQELSKKFQYIADFSILGET